MADKACVFIVDDDPAFLQASSQTLQRAGLRVRSFASGAEFLGCGVMDELSCLVLDLEMPHIDGLAVLQRFAMRGVSVPTVMVSSAADVPHCVQAFRLGVVDFLEKPISEGRFLQSVSDAMLRPIVVSRVPSPALWSAGAPRPSPTLTTREREVLEYLLAGKSLKQIASVCRFTVQTAWKHQQKILKKFRARNVVELARLMLAGTQDTPRDGVPPSACA